MAPEQISQKKYSKKIDIYATGIMLYMLMVGYHPLHNPGPLFADSTATLKLKVTAIEPEQWHYPSYISTYAKDLICRLCRISQIERYDAKKALQHPWITRNWDSTAPRTAKEERERQVLTENLRNCMKFMNAVAILGKNVMKKPQNASKENLCGFNLLSKAYLEKIKKHMQKDDALSPKSETPSNRDKEMQKIDFEACTP